LGLIDRPVHASHYLRLVIGLGFHPVRYCVPVEFEAGFIVCG
jgi:hypothetical protein